MLADNKTSPVKDVRCEMRCAALRQMFLGLNYKQSAARHGSKSSMYGYGGHKVGQMV